MNSSGKENPSYENTEIIEKEGEIPAQTLAIEINEKDDESTVKKKPKKGADIEYGIEDIPSLPMSIILGMQHYITMVGGTITIPYLLSPLMCIADDDPARAKMVSSILFVSGITTMLQTTLGVRLPIIQGGTFAFLLPAKSILTTTYPSCDTFDFSNMTTAETDEIWMTRMREIQGAVIVSSFFQVFVGFTGLIGYLLKFITPLTIVPTIALMGLSLFKAAANKASGHWGLALMTSALLIIFSQYLAEFAVPIPVYEKNKGFYWKKIQVFKLFPVILCLLISWGLCAILTVTDVLEPGSPGRTDVNLKLVEKSPWFYFPYPFQWGLPTVTISAVFGMLAGVISSMIESVGDYYACARLSGAPPPPRHAVSRGIGTEGIGCVIAGIIGTGNGTTSYSENIGAIRVTKVASRRVIQVGAVFMILFAMLGKFGAAFVTLPHPVVGGVFFVMFGIIAAVGLSNLQAVDLNSSRNLFVLGFSLFAGLAIPEWVTQNSDAFKFDPETTSTFKFIVLGQIIPVLLKTHMFVGGVLGLVFDNTIPGTDEERGLHEWTTVQQEDSVSSETYDLPFGMDIIRRTPWCTKVPFSPTYVPEKSTQDKSSIFSKIRSRLNIKSKQKFSPQ